MGDRIARFGRIYLPAELRYPTYLRNRVMLHLRVDDGWVYAAIGRLFGISGSAVSQIVYRESLRRSCGTACSLCGAPYGSLHVRLGPYLPRVKRVSVDDLGQGVRL